VAAGLTYRPARIPIVSNLTGRLADPQAHTDPQYWVRHLRGAVRFHQGVRALAAEHGATTFLELGPTPALTPMAAGTLAEINGGRAVAVPLIRGPEHETHDVLLAVATMFTRGHTGDGTALRPTGGSRVPLPTYAFQHRDYWLKAVLAADPKGFPEMDIEETAPPTEPAVEDAEQTLAALTERLAELGADQQQDYLLDLVRAETATSLGLESPDEVETDGAFFEIGFNSLMAVELRNHLRVLTGLELPAMLLFDYPTPGLVAEYLRDLIASGEAVPAGTDLEPEPTTVG